MRIHLTRRSGIAATALAVAAAATLTTTSLISSADAHGSNHSVGPIIFGHRGGATGYRPEHTAEDIALGAKFGVDYSEPDLVATKDGVLVDRHEPEISQTTDVASHPEFANRKRTLVIDGVSTTGWFTFDFTLKELKTLRTIERIPDVRERNTLYNGRDTVPTLQEDIDQVKSLEKQLGHPIGLVPEIKHSTFLDGIFGPNFMEKQLLAILHKNGLDNPKAKLPTTIQSFEIGNLKWLHQHTKLPLVQLTSAGAAVSGDGVPYASITTRQGLKGVAKYATWLGPDKNQIIPRDANNKLLAPTTLVKDSHAAGLKVVPYTFRNENSFLPADYQVGTNPADYGDAFAEYELFFEQGIDGLFTDNGDTAIDARADWIKAGRPLAH